MNCISIIIGNILTITFFEKCLRQIRLSNRIGKNKIKVLFLHSGVMNISIVSIMYIYLNVRNNSSKTDLKWEILNYRRRKSNA